MRLSCCVMLVCVLIASAGCSGWIVVGNGKRISQKRYASDQLVYETYRVQDTLEGYREFVERYPRNVFAGRARSAIQDLEFKSYEEADTIEGYLEFKLLHPDNPNTRTADWNIEQSEVHRYDRMDTIEGYREFLSKYPGSIFARTARERLQVLEMKDLAVRLEKQYGFDLLQYRLDVKRLKKKPAPDSVRLDLREFRLHCRVEQRRGQPWLRTYLLYGDRRLDGMTAAKLAQCFHRHLFPEMVGLLNKAGACRGGLHGFVFDAGFSPELFYGDREVVLECAYGAEVVRRFVARRIDAEGLRAAAVVTVPEPASTSPVTMAAAGQAPPRKQAPVAAKADPEPLPRSGDEVMACVARRALPRDAVLARRWQRRCGEGRLQEAATIEKHLCAGDGPKGGHKTVIKYSGTGGYGIDATQNANAILVDNRGQRGRKYWYILRRGDSGRTSLINSYRHVAESDLPMAEFVDVYPEEEHCELLRYEVQGGRQCAVVAAVPRTKKALPYGRRVLWIDAESWLPLTMEYYTTRGELWKRLSIVWQEQFGYCFWKRAEVSDLISGCTTTITTCDVRVNLGQHKRDFTPFGLERMVGK